MKQVGKSSSSPLKYPNGSWAITSVDKAELLAASFSSKWSLPEIEVNAFSVFSATLVPSDSVGFLRVRLRLVRAVLQELRVDSASGPDQLPARVLKLCARELALPVCLLARQIIRCSQWPASWCEHWLFPLHKRKVLTDPDNYRGAFNFGIVKICRAYNR